MSVEKVPGKKTTWRYRFQPKGSDKRISKSGFRTKAEARRAEAKAKLEWESKDKFKEKHTFDELFHEWLEINSPDLQPSTIQVRKGQYKKHIQKRFGQRDISDIGYRELQDYFLTLPLASSSQQGVLAIFSQVFLYAIRCGYIENNPAQYIKRSDNPVCEKSKLKIITDEQWQLLQDAFKDDRNVSMALMIGYYTGLRRSEIFGLKWEDFDDCWIHLQRQTTGKKFQTKDVLKTKKSKADIYMPQVLRDFLEPLKKEEGFLFTLWDHGCYNRIRKVMPDFHFHALRHTFVTRVVPYADQKTAMDLARHSTVQMTMEVYAHSIENNKVRTVDEAFGQDHVSFDGLLDKRPDQRKYKNRSAKK